MRNLNRRDFLKSSALAAAATAIPWTETIKPVWAQAPSDRLQPGLRGIEPVADAALRDGRQPV